MKETWYTIYDTKGKEAGEVLLEGRVERRENNDRAMGEIGRNLLRYAGYATGCWRPRRPRVGFAWVRLCVCTKLACFT